MLLLLKEKAGYTWRPVLFLKEAQVQALLSDIRTIPLWLQEAALTGFIPAQPQAKYPTDSSPFGPGPFPCSDPLPAQHEQATQQEPRAYAPAGNYFYFQHFIIKH